jgi:hypothetical protein
VFAAHDHAVFDSVFTPATAGNNAVKLDVWRTVSLSSAVHEALPAVQLSNLHRQSNLTVGRLAECRPRGKHLIGIKVTIEREFRPNKLANLAALLITHKFSPGRSYCSPNSINCNVQRDLIERHFAASINLPSHSGISSFFFAGRSINDPGETLQRVCSQFTVSIVVLLC